MEKTAGFIINCNAKYNKNNLSVIMDFVENKELPFFIEFTEKIDDIPKILEILLNRGIKTLLISGGDGTIHHVLTHLINLVGENGDLPEIIPIKGGTTNVIAEQLGNGVPTINALYYLKRNNGINSSYLRKTISIIKFIREGEKKPIYGAIFVTGIASRIQEEYYRSEDRSIITAFNTFIRIWYGSLVDKNIEQIYFKKNQVIAYIDGEKYPHDDYSIMVASIFPKIIFWFKPFGMDTFLIKKFYFLINSMTLSEIMPKAWSLSRGKYEGPFHFKGPVEKVEITFPGVFTIDGEVFYPSIQNMNELTITYGPTFVFGALPRYKSMIKMETSFFNLA